MLIVGCDQKRTDSAFNPSSDTYRVGSFNMRIGGSSQQVRGASVTSSFFQGSKVLALLGRGFLPDEYGQHRQVVVLSYRFWQRQFAGDPRVIGSSLDLDGQTFTVIGIMPNSLDVPSGVDIWVPNTQ
jgi:hypothetical protein